MAGQAVYGLVGGPGADQQQPPAAAAGPYVFAPADTTNPYAMTWTAYSTKLKPHLDATYSARAPAPARAVQAQAPAADAADAVKPEIARIKEYLAVDANQERRPRGYGKQQVNEAVNKATKSPAVSAIASAMPFDITAYRAAILAYLNANAPAGFNYSSVGP